MKQPISRNLYGRNKGVLAVYLQDGAPLTDAVWNEASDSSWSSARDAALDGGLQGTAGPELRVEPRYDKDTGRLTDFVLKGGPGRFYCQGIPIVWPRDVAYGHQPCGCDKVALGGLFTDEQPLPLVVWLETRVEMLDETDLPDFRDPAVQSDRGSFRRVVESCVRVATVKGVTPRVAGILKATDGVTEHINVKLLPKESEPTNVRMTVQGAYDGEENVHYRVELLKDRGQFDKYTYAVELLWDDRNASTVTRLVSDAGKFALSIEVKNSEGFEPGDHLRIEGDGLDGQVYEVTEVEGPRLWIRRSTCCTIVSLAETVLVAHTVDGDPADPASLTIHLTLSGNPKVQIGDLVKDIGKTKDSAATIPFGDEIWLVEKKESGPGQHEITIVVTPHFGLTEGLSPWGEPLTLMHHARIHEHCVVVEAATCWRPGMRVRISGKPRKTAGDPCWSPDEVDEGHECWPSRDPLFKDEDRTITWIERCGKHVECCHESHETMTLRLDVPLSADHSKCCDEVRPERVIKIRRYAGHECCAKLHAVWPCCDNTGGVCCMKPSFTLPSGLEVVLTYRGGTIPKYAPGDWWSFAARVGGWYESRVFDEPQESLRGASPLALILPPKGDEQHQFIDLRPIPAMFDQSGLLDEIARSSAELAEYFAGQTQSRFDRVAELAGYPRLQINVLRHKTWQLGLVELVYRIARDFVQTHAGSEKTVMPGVLAKSDVLAVSFKALAKAAISTRHKSSLSLRELKAIAEMLSRAASSAAGILGKDALVWPQFGDLDENGPYPTASLIDPPVCPDELPPSGDGEPDVPTPPDELPDRPENPPDQDPDRPPNPDDPPPRPENPDDPPPRPDNPDDDPPPRPKNPPPRPDNPDDPPPRPDNPDDPPPRPENPDEPPPRPDNPDVPPPRPENPDDPPPRPDNPDEPPPRPENPDEPPPRPDNPDEPPPRPENSPPRPENPDEPPPRPENLPPRPDNPGEPPPRPDNPDEPPPRPENPPPRPDNPNEPPPRPENPPDQPPIGPKPRVLSRISEGGDTSIGREFEHSDPDLADLPDVSGPMNDISVSGLAGRPGDEPDDASPAIAGIGELRTEDLVVLETLNPSTAHRIVADWPRLADVYAGRSEGAVRKRVIEAVHSFIADLRALFARPLKDESALAAMWARNVRAGVSRPPPEVLARSLPQPLTSEEE